MPSSLAIMAAWQVRPPRLVTIADALFMTGSQSGSVISATRTSPSSTKYISATFSITLAKPEPIFCPILLPVINTFDVCLSAKRVVMFLDLLWTVSGLA